MKNQYIQAPILISPKWELKFHVHTDASQLVVREIFTQNLIGKFDQPNSTKKKYIVTKKEALAMVYALHKLRHYLLSNRFVFYVDYMALVHSVNKPYVSSKLLGWLLLFMEYDFKIVYNLSKSHLIVDALSN
jgi:hypothetical protein